MKSTKTQFLNNLINHKKKIALVTIISLFVSGFLPYSFNNKIPANIQVSQSQLCCCGNDASCCQDCTCSENLLSSDNIGKYTVSITSCSGSSGDIITVSTLKYLQTPSVFFTYLSVAILAETGTQRSKDALIKPPYKPPKSQLLTHLT